MRIPEVFFGVNEELRLFLLSCAAGALIGTAFDALRALRVMIRHSRFFVMLEDIGFLCGYAVFLPAFASVTARGDMRLYFVIGNGLGFTLYYFTAGRFVLATMNRLFGLIRGVLRWITRPLRSLYALICKKARCKFVGSNKSLVKFIKKALCPLKTALNLLYNKLESTNRKNVNLIGKNRNKRKKEKSFKK